jgi:BirA family biotin operon repressor/biotin-[acetyl-CoA-carboxylase] ligase
MVDERKLAGVLVESRVKGNQLVYAVLGIGVNVNFESSLIHQTSKTSTSLLTLLGHHVDREGLIADVLYGIERMYDSICRSEQPELVDLLRQMDCSRGKRVRVKTARKEVTGIIEDYQSLTEVRIITRDGCRVVGLDSLESVDYESD